VLGESRTDETGAFAVDVGAASLVGARIEVAATMQSAALEAWVTSNSEVLHAIRVPVLGADNLVRASAQASDMRIAGPFNVLDRLARLEDYIVANAPSGTTLPRIVVHWEVGSTDGTNAHSNTGTTFGMGCVVRLLGQPDVDDDAFDDTVIAHELGHCVDFAFSSDAAPGWNGHSGSIPLDPGLALNEGFATFFGQRVSGTSMYVDTRGPSDGFGFDIDDPAGSGQHLGLMGEWAVAGALWDLLDSGPGDDDTLALTPAQFWTVFDEDVRDGIYKSIHAYFDAVVARGYATDAQLDLAFGGPLDLHRPASPSFPLAMLVPGVPVTGDVDATVGAMIDARGRGDAIDDWGFEVTTATMTHVALTNVGGRNDLDLFVQDAQRYNVARSDATGTGDEAIDVMLAPGRYVIVVRAYTGPDTAAPYSLGVTTL
jgi:hypothetical protein